MVQAENAKEEAHNKQPEAGESKQETQIKAESKQEDDAPPPVVDVKKEAAAQIKPEAANTAEEKSAVPIPESAATNKKRGRDNEGDDNDAALPEAKRVAGNVVEEMKGV
jgi:hypothetical protein